MPSLSTAAFGAFCVLIILLFIGRSAGGSDSQYELVLLRDALSQSVEALSHDQLSLPSQLLGRLMPHIRGSSPWQWYAIILVNIEFVHHIIERGSHELYISYCNCSVK